MAGGFHCIKNLSRRLCLTPFLTNSTNHGICQLTSLNGLQSRQLLSSIRYVQASTISSSPMMVNKLPHRSNKGKLIVLGIASGIGVGFAASLGIGECYMSALSAEETDPTTIESGWLPKTEEIYAKLLSRVDSGELKLLRTTKKPIDRVVYSLSHPQKGAHFEYAFFLEKDSQKGLAVVQFGPQTQGPPGYVHGGATATMFDTITGVYLHGGLEKRCLTANLNINYRRPIPLNSTVIAETWVEKIEGRKNHVRCELKSLDGQVYIEGTALWISVRQ